MTVFRRMLLDRSGGPLIEYAVAFSVFALFCVVAFVQFAGTAANRYSTSTTQMTSIQESPLPTTVP